MKRHGSRWRRRVTPFLEKVDSKDVVENLNRIVRSRFKDAAHFETLEEAVNDALSVAKKLKETGFDEIIQIVDQEATRERILTLLGVELPKKVGPEDRVVIFFAGHGQTETLADGGEQGYIIPVDGNISNYFATAISMTQIRELSQRIPAKHLLYVMDACYSGHGFTRASGLDPLMNGYVEKITAQRAVQMITAGGKNEQVMESKGHGMFTLYFLRGLAGEADRDTDEIITTSELGDYLMPQVSRATENLQTPQYGRLDREGKVVFTVPSQKRFQTDLKICAKPWGSFRQRAGC